MIAEGRTVAEIVAVGNGWPERMRYLRPDYFLELGTGQGASGARIMPELAPDAHFITINYANGHTFGEQLRNWYSDPRLTRIAADTIDPDTLVMVPDGVDLLFVDTTHEAWHAATELRMWQDKLQDGAIVIVDDLNQHDMMDFWDSIHYEKALDNAGACQGVFRYNAMSPYDARFERRGYTTYGGGIK